MTLNSILFNKALDVLRRRNIRRADGVRAAIDELSESPLFKDRDTDEVETYAKAALQRLEDVQETTRQLPTDVKAPFVFVTLPDEVVEPADEHRLDLQSRDGFCATITYELEAETPLLVGTEAEREGTDKGAVLPIRLGRAGDYVIPGATMRGLVRAAVEIVAHGKLGSANLHHRFGLRDFEHPYYEQVAKVDRVNAGWLTGKVDEITGKVTAMQITPCDWAHVLIDDMASSPEFAGKVSRRESWIQKSLTDKYAALGMASSGGQQVRYDFTKTFGYGPAFEDQGRRIRKPAKGGVAGVPVVSGKLPGAGGNKKFEYAFFDQPGAAPVDIPDHLIDDFVRMNSKPSKNRPAPDGSWKELKPTFAEGKPVPVFYVGDLAARGRDFFFGLTRMLKLPHERSVGEVLRQQPRHVATATWREAPDGTQEIVRYDADFVESLFGYVVEPRDFLDRPANSAPQGIARKGRVAFSFATLDEKLGSAKLSEPVRVVQSAPRASFSPFYLKPATPGRKDREPDYSAENPPRLAGRKRYLPRDEQVDPQGRLGKIRDMGQRQLDAIKGVGGRVSEDVQSRLRVLLPENPQKPLVFRGEIRLHNVSAAELGAVLFAFTHGGDPRKPYRHMVGRAKPFGAGQMRLRSLDLAAEANAGMPVAAPDDDERLSADTQTGFCSDKGTAGLKPFLAEFTRHMRQQPGLQAFPNVPAVLEFLGASDPALGAAREAKLDYMPLGDFNPVRKAVKPLKDPNARPPARGAAPDGRLLPAPRASKPVFWT